MKNNRLLIRALSLGIGCFGVAFNLELMGYGSEALWECVGNCGPCEACASICDEQLMSDNPDWSLADPNIQCPVAAPPSRPGPRP